MSRLEDYLHYRTYGGQFGGYRWGARDRRVVFGEWLRDNLLALVLAAVLFGLGFMVISSVDLPGQHAAGIDVIPHGWQPWTLDDDGRPVPNPKACDGLSWGIVPNGAPYGGFEVDAARAAVKIAAASGIALEYEGHFGLDEIDEVHVLIGWADDPQFPGRAIGLASMWGDGGGLIWLRRTWEDDPGFDGGWGSVLLHEWGHLIGLDHVDDPTSVMNGEGLGERLNRGDRRGLWALGRGSCS